MRIRRILASDIKHIFVWRNHDKIRENFFDSNEITFTDHEKWVLSMINSIKNELLLVSIERNDVGVVRFDLSETIAEVSIYLNPDFIGKGLGFNVLEIGLNWLKSHCEKVNEVRSKILPSNLPSIKIFEKAGFNVDHICYKTEI